MNETERTKRIHELLRSPGGCALLLEIEARRIDLAVVVDPLNALHLVAMAASGHLNPWVDTHDHDVAAIRRHGSKLTALAEALVDHPGIEQWWAPLDRASQVWTQPEGRLSFPTPETFPVPTGPPTRNDKYIHQPSGGIDTSTRIEGTTSQIATVVSGSTDWWIDRYEAQRNHITINPAARVLEIQSAEDWHELVVRHGVQSHPKDAFNVSVEGNMPWGPNDGLVPDWSSAAREWDGVHITLWAFLTATQVRITTAAGWSEPWVWDAEKTIWLHWVFDWVGEMRPVQATPNEEMFLFDWRDDIERMPRYMQSVVTVLPSGDIKNWAVGETE